MLAVNTYGAVELLISIGDSARSGDLAIMAIFGMFTTYSYVKLIANIAKSPELAAYIEIVPCLASSWRKQRVSSAEGTLRSNESRSLCKKYVEGEVKSHIMLSAVEDLLCVYAGCESTTSAHICPPPLP